MECRCLNITPAMLEENPELALRLGSGCDSCPMLMVEETERRSGKDRRNEPREPKGRRKIELAKPAVVNSINEMPDIDFVVEKQRIPTKTTISYKEKKDYVKVFMVLSSGESFFAKVFVKSTERLQDLMNDDREFIPIQKLTARGRGEWITAVIRKSSIISIEER